MRTRAFAICLVLLLTIVSFTSIMSTQGVGEGEWIKSYTVEDPATDQLMVEVNFDTEPVTNRSLSPIFAGSEVAITFTVDVSVTSPNTILKLKTAMIHPDTQDAYWELVSQEYELIAYNPNSLEVTFYQVKGELTMTLYGKVPVTVARDIPVQYLVVTLYGPAGEILDNIKVTVVTVETSEYQTVLLQKEEELQSLKDRGVASGYIELYENVLNESKVQASLGNVESALAMLDTLSVANPPASSTVESLFLPVVGVLIALAAVLAFMFIRGRGKLQYVLLVLEDQIRDLEGLTLRASRVDRTLSSSLESIKDRLKSVVGM